MSQEKKWRALDHCEDHRQREEDVAQPGEQDIETDQSSYEWIIVRDSEDVNVHTTDTQAAVSLQAALQAAIAAVVSISIGDTITGNAVVQEVNQVIKTKQKNTQKTIIEGSKHVEVITTDTDISVNIQVLIQVLIAIVVRLDIL